MYTIQDGRVGRHEERWDISSADAFISTLIPSYGAPPAPPVEQLRSAASAAALKELLKCRLAGTDGSLH